MNRRPKVSVKYHQNGRETIVDKAIYKMNLIGSEDSSSSGIEDKIRPKNR